MTLSSLCLIITLLVFTACANDNSKTIEISASEVVSLTQTFTEEFMDLVNDHRQKLGLRALINDEEISKIAQSHSENMASGKVDFGHDGLSSRCSSARAAIGGGNLCAENVASGQKSPQAVFNSWMNSTAHRNNIEHVRQTHSGFGFKNNYWTHLFIEQN